MHGRHNGANQRWKVVYLDAMKKGPTKGLNRNFGFYINRPFLIMSRLPMRRVIEITGSNVVLRAYHPGRKTQRW